MEILILDFWEGPLTYTWNGSLEVLTYCSVTLHDVKETMWAGTPGEHHQGLNETGGVSPAELTPVIRCQYAYIFSFNFHSDCGKSGIQRNLTALFEIDLYPGSNRTPLFLNIWVHIISDTIYNDVGIYTILRYIVP